MKLILPFPITSNQYWRCIFARGRCRTIVSADARDYKKKVARAWLEQKLLRKLKPFEPKERLQVKVDIYPERRNTYDTDNCLKVLLDSISGDLMPIPNDKQVKIINAYMWDETATKPGKVEIEIRKLSDRPVSKEDDVIDAVAPI